MKPLSRRTKIIALSGAAAALALLTYSVASNAQPNPPNPNPPNPGPGPGPRRPKNLPAGAGEATVLIDPGMNARTGPSTGASLLATNDAFVGDIVGVLQTGLKASTGDPAPVEWWKIVTPGGGVGYSRAVDAQGVKNFRLDKAPQNSGDLPVTAGGGQDIAVEVGPSTPDSPNNGLGGNATTDPRGASAFAGMAGRHRPFGGRRAPSIGSYNPFAHVAIGATFRSMARCVASAGCYLRKLPQPGGPGGVVVPPGASVQLLQIVPGPKASASSPSAGGWSRVRYGNVIGWLPTEYLVQTMHG